MHTLVQSIGRQKSVFAKTRRQSKLRILKPISSYKRPRPGGGITDVKTAKNTIQHNYGGANLVTTKCTIERKKPGNNELPGNFFERKSII